MKKNRNPFIDHPEYVGSIWNNVTSTMAINEPEFKVYPNPATDFLNIELESNKNYKGFIYSLTGESVLEFQVTGSLTLSTDNLNSGSYLLILQHEGYIHPFSVMILK